MLLKKTRHCAGFLLVFSSLAITSPYEDNYILDELDLAINSEIHKIQVLKLNRIITMTFTNAVLESFKKRMHDILNKEPVLKKKYQERTMAKILRLANEAELPASKILNALNGTSPTSSKTVKTSKGIKKTLVRAKVAAKYRNPVDPSLTWTGRGKAPTWCSDLREKGQLDSALIDPTTQLGQVAMHVGQ